MEKMQVNPFDIHAAYPFASDEVFVGRASEMHALVEHFGDKTHRLANISGMRGTGKTTFALMYAHQAEKTFPGAIEYICVFSPESIGDTVRREIGRPETERHLAILDELDSADRQTLEVIPDLLNRDRFLSLLLVSHYPVEIPHREMLSLSLGGFSQAEFHEMIQRRLAFAGVSKSESEMLYAASQGNPLLADAACRSVGEGLVTFQQFVRAFRSFDYSPIRGPDGKPFQDGLVAPEQVVVSVSDVNEALLARLRRDPELSRSLSPRKFEEVVASLLEKQGYTVELTPASGDGGFDMYAAKHEALGKFLYLVECKRYTPPNKVGVQVVRALHGVVQQKEANAGVIVTTAFFTRGAKEFQSTLKHKLQLRNYIELQKWLGII